LSYIGVPPQATFSSGLLDRFTSTTGTTVTLTHDIASENDIVVFVNFVKQDSTTYSVGGTGNKTLTLGGTLVSSDIVEVHYLNIVGQTVAPSSGSVGSSQLTSGAVTGAKLNTDVISAQTELASGVASTDELLISDAGVLKRVDVSLVGGTNTPNFFAYANADQTISHDTSTKLQINTEVYDSGSAYDNSNYKFVVPSGQGGKYNFTLQVFLYDSNGNLNGIRPKFYKNGSVVSEAEWQKESGGNKRFYNYSSNTNVTLNLSASDYIEPYVLAPTNDSGTFIMDGHATIYRNFFTGYKIIE